jgi:hypothetical protein
MELTAGNLSRPRALAANSKSVQGVLFSARSEMRAPASKSLRLGWDFHTSANFFQICPRPLHTYMPHKIFPRTPLDRF